MIKAISAYAGLSDRQLVTAIKTGPSTLRINELTHALYSRYDNFVHKHWYMLSRTLNTSCLVQEVKDDFYSESYLSFMKALNATSLDKIRDNKWKFLGYYGFYLSNQRKVFAKKIIQKYHIETSLEIPKTSQSDKNTMILSDISETGVVSSAEDNFIESDTKRRFWTGLAHCKKQIWGNIENRIFDLREQKKSIRVICDDLKISPWKYNKLLATMRIQLEHEIERC